MIIDVEIPKLPESVSEASLATWKKREGDIVQRDENLVDMETDKIVLELPAPQGGTLVSIIAKDGETVTAGQVIARIDTSVSAALSSTATTEAVVDTHQSSALSAQASGQSAMAMPSAEKLAAELGIDLAALQGSGLGGRILKEDVLSASSLSKTMPTSTIPTSDFVSAPVRAPLLAPLPVAEPASNPVSEAPMLSATTMPADNVSAASQAAQVAPTIAPAKPAPATDLTPPVIDDSREQLEPNNRERREPMSRLRQAVAGRLFLSQQTNVILTTFNEVNMKPLMDLRAKYKERFEKEHSVKLGIMSFFVKAAVHALKKYPVLNARIEGTDIVYNTFYDIGVAVGSARGLVVPILRDADKLSLADIEKQITDFGKRAQDGRISIEEMTGGTYTITNGGVFGSMMSTPIINPPQSAILGMHATKERAMVEDGQIVARPMMYLAQSYDHRLIDGREAVLSLVTIKDVLEDPARLLLDL